MIPASAVAFAKLDLNPSAAQKIAASAAAYVNLDAIATDLQAQGGSGQDLRQLAAFRTIGLIVATAGDTSTMHLRLVAR